MEDAGRLRIGELSRRTGVSVELLRAWETRYSLVTPDRTGGGLRLYSSEDERRVRLMRENIDAGLSAAEAARIVRAAGSAQPSAPGAPPSTGLAEMAAALDRSLAALDEPGAQLQLDRLFSGFGVETVLGEVVLPLLRHVGSRWAAAEATVAEEHFVSNVLGGRLRALARGWGQGVGPLALLACPPGEQHELGLISFGLLLRERGWRVSYLGADTPLGDVRGMLDRASPAILVLSSIAPERFLDAADDIAGLASRVRVGIGGPGVTPALAERLRAEPLTRGLVEEAAALSP